MESVRHLRHALVLLGLSVYAFAAAPAATGISAHDFLASPGAQAFKAGDYAQALAGFESLSRSYPDEVLILRYLAISYERLGRYAEALGAYEQALRIDPENQALHYFRGIAYFKKPEVENAEASFRRCIALSPDSAYAGRAQQYLAVLEQQRARYERPGAPKPWEVHLQAGMQFDDNIPTGPDSDPGDQDSFGFFQYLAAGYTAFQKGGWRARAEASTYQSQHLDEGLGAFNLSSFDAGLNIDYAGHWLGKSGLAGLRYDYRPVLLEGDRFSDSHHFTSSLDVETSDATTLRLFHRLSRDDFSADGFDPGIASRDALANAVGVTPHLFFNERQGYVWAGYEYQSNDAEGLNFDFHGHQASGGLSAALSGAFRADLGADYAREDYPHFQGPRDRRTDRWRLSAALSTRLANELALALAYHYTDEDSNYSVLEYTRHVATLALLYQF